MEASGHPYTSVAARNVFHLLPPTPAPVPPPAPLPKVTLVGITTIPHEKRAFLKVQFPAQPPAPPREVSCVLTLGQREGAIEVLAIDETAGTVTVNNSGTEMVLHFATGASPPQGAPLYSASRAPLPPNPPPPPPIRP